MAMELYFRGPFSSQGLLIGKSKDLGFFLNKAVKIYVTI